MADQVEEVKSKVDMVQLVTEYVPLKKAGRNFKGLCPFHGEKTPSFMVNPELQIFKCFGCGEGGDAYSFLQKMEGMEFGEALKTLADRVGVKLESYRPTQTEEIKEKLVKINSLAAEFYHYLLVKHKTGEEARNYLKKRGVESEAVEKFKLGYVPEGWDYAIGYLSGKKGHKAEDLERAGLVIRGERYYDRFRNRIMFPLTNHRGQIVGFAGRVMPGGDEKSGKYVNTPETEIYHKSDLLYGLDSNKTEIKTTGEAVVVEGELDMIASWQAGVKNTVAVKGSALTEKQVDLLRRYAGTIVLALDADVAGDVAARRGIETAEKAGVVVKILNSKSETLNPKKYKDPGDWGIEDPKGWRAAVGGAIPIYDFYLESAVSRFGLDGVGKGKISRELIPLWSGIPDDIVKAHYIQKLAQVLGVGEEDVRHQMAKIQNSNPQITKQIQNSSEEKIKTRREVLEEYIVGIALRQGWIDRIIGEPVRGWMKTQFWLKVAEELEEKKGGGKKTVTLIKGLPAELRSKVEGLMLVEDYFEEEGAEKEWQDAVDELEELNIRERINEVKNQEDKKELMKLTRRLAVLTKNG
ncbi:MAG: primase protein [Candidatus Amesbacteria bacterium GW2011_GWB1_47_19]|nr:MAG: primase protein [Candidatus Amesbacteria bacterium GW2011_GWA1_44_24]KKU66501.1 MAG: primase protein [Candidatus Amesbacteria bacterium GW2011_GWB1_47_19]HBC73237.1 DNA primase [Candidatus Amesbacteria bacterium]